MASDLDASGGPDSVLSTLSVLCDTSLKATYDGENGDVFQILAAHVLDKQALKRVCEHGSLTVRMLAANGMPESVAQFDLHGVPFRKKSYTMLKGTITRGKDTGAVPLLCLGRAKVSSAQLHFDDDEDEVWVMTVPSADTVSFTLGSFGTVDSVGQLPDDEETWRLFQASRLDRDRVPARIQWSAIPDTCPQQFLRDACSDRAITLLARLNVANDSYRFLYLTYSPEISYSTNPDEKEAFSQALMYMSVPSAVIAPGTFLDVRHKRSTIKATSPLLMRRVPAK